MTTEKCPLLLLHGALGSKSTLEPLYQILEKDFMVYSLDFVGHGEDDRKPDAFTMEDFVDDILTFMEEHHLEKVSIFGYSMGGYVALKMASKYPEKIDRIITLGTKFKWNPESAQHETRFLNPQKTKEKVPAFAEVLSKRHTYHNWEDLMFKTAQMMLGLGNGQALSENELERITIPVKIMMGDQDNMVSAEESQRISSQLPNATFKILLNTAHPIEQVYWGSLVEEIITFTD